MTNLYTTYYREPRMERRHELELALALNVDSFDNVSVLSECAMPPCRAYVHVSARRQTYAKLIEWAQECDDEDIAVIANCDIYIPRESIEQMQSIEPGEAWCLARWEIGRGMARLWDVDYSQDTWVFRGKPRRVGGNYFFGIPGCDNRFCHELKQGGYRLGNPSKTVKTYHIHASRQRTATNSRDFRLPPPYLFLKPTELEAEPVESERERP